MAVAGASVVAAGAAYAVDRAWRLDIVGHDFPGIAIPFRHETGDYLNDRIEGLMVTWLRPTQTGGGLVVLALLVMLAALVVGAVRSRRADGATRPVVVAGVVAAVAAVIAVLADPTNVVPGLLVAFPLAAAGLVALSRRSLSTPVTGLAAATFAIFALAVLATQYRTGGTGEWGGRYFALGLPALVPAVLLALRERGVALAPIARRVGAASLAACSVALASMAVASHRSANDDSARLASWVLAASAPAALANPASPSETPPLALPATSIATPATADERPVIVSTDEVLPRLAWAAFDERRWLVSAPTQLGGLVGRLRGAGIDRFALITADPVGIRGLLGGASVLSVDSRSAGQGLSVLVVSSALGSTVLPEVVP